MLHMSVSSLKDFLVCRRLYYYKRIKKYNRSVFAMKFVVGRTIHTGLNYLFEKKPNALELMGEYLKTEAHDANKEFVLDEEQKKEFNEQQYVTQGMLAAYAKKYEKMIRDTTLIGSEVEAAIQYGDDVTFVIKLDNLIRIRKKKILHELKTSKYITKDYIQMIRTDVQTAAYFYVHNLIYEKDKIEEVMYDVIRKPSIRLKKQESYPSYLERLADWYDRPGDETVFHVERFTQPLISQESLLNTIGKVSEDMLRSKTKEDYYQDFDQCASYYGEKCPYFELCHEGGETPANLVLYTIRKPYKVNTSNKPLKG
jgi:PD-(D/E)XK nuclease superfamily